MCACVGGGGGVGLLPNKCYWCMDVLLREQKVYVDTVKLISNIKICKKDKKHKTLFQNCSSNFLFQLIMSAWEHTCS